MQVHEWEGVVAKHEETECPRLRNQETGEFSAERD